jgi:hypothetical protein
MIVDTKRMIEWPGAISTCAIERLLKDMKALSSRGFSLGTIRIVPE